MKRVIALAAALVAAVYCEAARAAEKFTDPVRNISFSVPTGKWEIAEGFGENIAVLKNSRGEKIGVDWIRGGDTPLTAGVLTGLAGAHFRGAKIISAGGSSISAEFAGPHGDRTYKGEIKVLPADEGNLVISCTAPEENYPDFHFTCENFAAGTGQVKEYVPFGEMAKRVSARASFAILDGRAGCPEIAYEAEKLGRVSRDLSDRETEKYFKELAAVLRGEKRHDPSKILGGGEAGFFRKLALARLCLEDADADCALKHLKNSGPRSKLSLALKIWAAGIRGDTKARREAEAEMDGEFCGESGAMALYHLGLSESNSDAAAQRFLDAVEAAPSFRLPYIKLIEIAAKK